ncbi:MAG: oxaloacetate decarboxylase [Lautropia sp.]
MPIDEMRSRFRGLLSGSHCVILATVFDPLSARVAEDLGYEAGLMGGSIASHAVLAAPDVVLLTLTELVEQVRRAVRVSAVPLLVDADHGYGNALNVMRTISELAHAGAAAAMIEDTLLPAAFGPGREPKLLSFEESVAKIKAAVSAGRRSGMIVLGRTSAAAITGVEDAIARLRAFEVAGVEALFVPGLRSRDELDRIAAAVKLPLVVGGAAEALCDPGYLASRRVRLWSGGHQPLIVAVQALHDAMKRVLEGALPAHLPAAGSVPLFDRLIHAKQVDDWTREFLS